MGGGVINNWVENWFCLEGVLGWKQAGVSRCYVAKLVLIMSSPPPLLFYHNYKCKLAFFFSFKLLIFLLNKLLTYKLLI